MKYILFNKYILKSTKKTYYKDIDISDVPLHQFKLFNGGLYQMNHEITE